MLKKLVSSNRSPSEKRASTSALVTWSATTTPSASANQRQALSMRAPLARAVQVDLAAPAERLVIDVGAVVPAALALAVRARLDRDLRRPAVHVGRRGQHHELQVLAEAAEHLEVLRLGMELDLRLERRADLARGAQLLDLLAHRGAQLAEPRPP